MKWQLTHQSYPQETVGNKMSSAVPQCRPTDTYRTILSLMATRDWDSIRSLYITDNDGRLLGIVSMTALMQANRHAQAKDLMQPVHTTLHPFDDQEKALFIAVKNDLLAIPVVDKSGVFLGAITARNIIDIMHAEHVEDTLLTAGIHTSYTSIVKLAAERTGLIVRSRAPWLLFGLLMGLGLGVIASWFEASLQRNVAIAYFIPVVAYIADSVGTQSEAIAVRALATVRIRYLSYLAKELLVGTTLGISVGVLGGLGALLIAHSADIGLAVGLALFAASAVAAVLASLIPILFKVLGKDPALGSGPLATALQDVISVVIYFLFATALV